jgi:von Willebrand factor A domain-containing protein 7
MKPVLPESSRVRYTKLLIASGLISCFALSSLAQTQTPNRPRNPSGKLCGRSDPAYIRTANETGGVPMFLQPSEVEKSFHLVRESSRNDVSDVFWATGKIDGRAQTVQIPVDSVTKRITFTFSVDTQGGALSLIQPSGRRTSQAADTEITELTCGRIVTVNSPEPGTWRAEITGTGVFWLEAQAQSDIYFISVEFVRRGGRPGHEGLFRIQGQPVSGAPATLQTSMSAESAETTEFQLVSERGEIIQRLPMRTVNSDREFLEFVGALELPTTAFRLAVTGRDRNGRQYQRFFHTLFHAESVEVSPMSDLDDLTAGSTSQMAFSIRNAGPARRFKVTVTDAHRFATKVEPSELSLGSGESATIRVDLAVPAGAKSGGGDDLIVLASSTTGPATSNSSVVHISVR